jgi:hypothetical protein
MMTRWFKNSVKPSAEDNVDEDQIRLLRSLRQAQKEWINARSRLDWVVEKDQVDYAIYALEAAERKYEMLLRQAKKYNWDITAIAKGEAM